MESQEDEEEYVRALEALAKHLNMKKQTGVDADRNEFEPVSFEYKGRIHGEDSGPLTAKGRYIVRLDVIPRKLTW